MNAIGRKTIFVVVPLLIVYSIGGCEQQGGLGRESRDLAPTADLGATIGSLGRILSPESIWLEGYGLVSGLKGTGSADCPPQIRAYLARYVQKLLPSRRMLDVEEFINSADTAVVLVEGIMPAVASDSQYFDLRVTALPGTQTVSLEGGWLLDTELKTAGSFRVATRVLADAKGPVLIDSLSGSGTNGRVGYILAGGKAFDEYKVGLVLHKPDFAVTSSIRNRLNGRFGAGTAKAVRSGQIELTVPAKYKQQKQRFIAIVRAMYLTQGPEITGKRITTFVRRLVGSQDKYASEAALEAIGNESIGKLSILLSSSDERVRLHAARCVLNLGGDAGFETLRQIAMDRGSVYRFDALESITVSARPSDAASVSRNLLRDDDLNMTLAAYEQLRRLDDVAIAQESIARHFYLERITQTERKVIFVSRSGQPRIVLFGVQIDCHGSIFVGTADGDITINAPTGAEYVTIIRKHPTRPSVIAKLKSSFEIGDIIKTLCEEPLKEGEQGRGGLGVSYADAIVLLKQMCDKGAVRAEFRAGPLPKISLIVKK
jgi:hypothetical protein